MPPVLRNRAVVVQPPTRKRALESLRTRIKRVRTSICSVGSGLRAANPDPCNVCQEVEKDLFAAACDLLFQLYRLDALVNQRLLSLVE